MLTIKVIYLTGQTFIDEAREFSISSDNQEIEYKKADGLTMNLSLEGDETVYIENSSGKTIHTLYPKLF